MRRSASPTSVPGVVITSAPSFRASARYPVELRLLSLAQRLPGIDVRHNPRSFHRGREAAGITNQFFGGGSAAHRDKQTVTAFPRPGDPFLLHDVAQVAIDMFRDDPQRHFSQCGQIALAEEILRCGRGAVGEVNFTFRQAVRGVARASGR